MLKNINLFSAPVDVTKEQRKNFINVQIDAIGIGLANAASPFLPVLLTQLGATNTHRLSTFRLVVAHSKPDDGSG